MSEPGWRPLLTGELQARAVRAVAAVAAELTEPSRVLAHSVDRASLSYGAPGLALLYGYLARAGRQVDLGASPDRFTEIAMEYLNIAIEHASTSTMADGLYGGLGGVGWVVQHVLGGLAADEGQETEQIEEVNRTVDEFLLARTGGDMWRHDTGLIAGLAGIGVYALERLPRAAACELLSRLVNHLAGLAEHGPSGTTWLTPPHLASALAGDAYPGGYYNCGVAHGVPGILAVLAQIASATELEHGTRERARRLVDGAARWLVSLTRPILDGSNLPEFTDGRRDPGPCRLAWCYGDAGVAAALLVAGRCTGNRDLCTFARELARRTLHRAAAQCGVVDAGLCHGGAGLALIYARLFHYTGDDDLAAAAVDWTQDALRRRRPGQGIAGFVTYWGEHAGTADGYRLDVGFIDGAPGTALALLALASAQEPRWDRCLLLSSALHEPRS
jgi:hypothetical protein